MSEVTEIVEPMLDAASEAILEGVDGVVETLEVFRTNPKLLVVAWLGGACIGASVGYFVARIKLRKFYEELSTREITEAKEFYSQLNKIDEDGAVLTPQQVMEMRHGPEAAADALKVYQGHSTVVNETHIPSDAETAEEIAEEEALLEKAEAAAKQMAEEASTINVFEDPMFDLAEEMKYRTADKPYIITHDEYFAAEKGYDTVSLTYFETDDTLVDEQDVPIADPDASIGEDHLVKFGHGSKDNNIVYVRNDKLGIDYEVIKSTGSYLEEVLGMGDEEPNSLKHSSQRDLRRALRHGD